MIFLKAVPIEIVTETIPILRESAYKTVPSWLVQKNYAVWNSGLSVPLVHPFAWKHFT